MRTTGLASLLILFALPATCFADDSLSLTLPSFHAGTETAAEQAAPPAPKMHRNPAANVPTAPNRHGSVSRPVNEKVIGRLGVSTSITAIRSRRSSSADALAEVKPGTYLAITANAGNWYGVLMADRRIGWLRKSAVNVLSYEVVMPDAPDRHQYANEVPTNASSGARSILSEAYRYLGVPYRWGGTSPNGMDCSAFVQRCFNTVGISLPRTAHEQAAVGMPINNTNELQPADRLYFASRDGRITHTGIYIGNGLFIHSSSLHHGVAVSRLDEPLYSHMYAGARR